MTFFLCAIATSLMAAQVAAAPSANPRHLSPNTPSSVHACVLSSRLTSTEQHPLYPSRDTVADPAAHAAFIADAYRRNAANAASSCGFHRTLLYNPAHCGLGDRARGLVTTFYMALLTHAGFGLDWHVPFALDDYFNVPEFRVGDAGMDNATVSTINNWAYYTDTDYHAHLTSLNASTIIVNANSFHWKEVVDHPAHTRAAQMYGLAGLTRHQLYRVAFNIFFGSPKPMLAAAVEKVLPRGVLISSKDHLTNHNLKSNAVERHVRRSNAGAQQMRSIARSSRGLVVETKEKARRAADNAGAARVADTSSRHPAQRPPLPPLIAIQLRTGGVGEVWEETRFHRHPLSSVACFAGEARALCAQMGGCRLFLTADSAMAATEFTRQLSIEWRRSSGASTNTVPFPDVIQAPGLTLHADQPVPAALKGTRFPFTKTFVDWLTISRADALVMSHSGFGWTAAWGGGVPYMRQLVWGRGEHETCTWIAFDECASLQQFA